MSAFIVDTRHIDAMITAVLCPRHQVHWKGKSGYTTGLNGDWCQLDHTCADSVGRMLLMENIRSVRYRYPGDKPGDLPGPIPNPIPDDYEYRPILNCVPTVVQAIKLFQCYEYQSCETPDWEESEAYRFCESAVKHLISRLPGYEDADWEFRPTVTVGNKVVIR